MNTILNSGGIKDAIGVLFVVITGLLYATGVTETATDLVCDVGLDESSVGAAIEVPQGSGCRGADYLSHHVARRVRATQNESLNVLNLFRAPTDRNLTCCGV